MLQEELAEAEQWLCEVHGCWKPPGNKHWAWTVCVFGDKLMLHVEKGKWFVHINHKSFLPMFSPAKVYVTWVDYYEVWLPAPLCINFCRVCVQRTFFSWHLQRRGTQRRRYRERLTGGNYLTATLLWTQLRIRMSWNYFWNECLFLWGHTCV